MSQLAVVSLHNCAPKSSGGNKQTEKRQIRSHETSYSLKSIEATSCKHRTIETNPDVLAIADQLDIERAAGIVRGPTHGIPVVVKDNIATKDKMETTAGSYALLGSIVPRDAHVVKLPREADAILSGKSTLDEWALMRSNSKSSDYSARGGQSRNAYNLSTAAGDSSSGPAQAVAANLVAVAYGTETDDSVVGPTGRAGLAGFKPTVGLTSRAGVVPGSVHQDTVGSFGRTFRDAVYALEAIVSVDPRDNYTLAQGVPAWGNYTQFLATKGEMNSSYFECLSYLDRVSRAEGIDAALIGTAWSEPSLVRCGSALNDLIRGRKWSAFVDWWARNAPVDYSL